MHEAYLQMAPTDTSFEDCAHFMVIAAMTMRHILVNHAKTAQRVKRGGLKKVLATINVDEALLVQSDPADILDLNKALDRLAQREIGDGTGRRLSNMLRYDCVKGTAGQRRSGFPNSFSAEVGAVKETPGGGGALLNWQIKGGTGANLLSIDPNTGVIRLADVGKLDPRTTSYTLVLMASDGILPSTCRI